MFCTACTYSLLMPSSSSTLEVSDLLPEQQLTVSDFFFPIEKPLHFEPRYGQSCAHHCSAEPCKWGAVVQRVPGLGHPPWGNDLALCFDILPVPKPGERPGSCSQQCAGGWLFSVSPSIPVLIPIPPHPSLCPRSPISQPIPAPQHHPVASATRSSSLTPVQPGLCCWDAEMAWFGVWGLGFRLWGLGFGFLWFGVWGLGFPPHPLGTGCTVRLSVRPLPLGNHDVTFYPGSSCHSWQNVIPTLAYCPNPLLGVPAQPTWVWPAQESLCATGTCQEHPLPREHTVLSFFIRDLAL